VAELSVADQINHNIFEELLTEFSGKLEGSLDILHTVSINMEYWRVDALSNIRCVDTGPTLVWCCCETDLVVHNHMNCAADIVVGE
jgi:hypothetical protein